jgi:hypothetical protein
MKQNLANWAPEYLKKVYASELDRLANNELTLKQKEVFAKRIEVLYRLGSRLDMKAVWKKLLAKDLVVKSHPVDKGLLAVNASVDNEFLLVEGIIELIWFNSFGVKQSTPSQKKEQFDEISEKIKELQGLIRKSGEAKFEDMTVLENILHIRNIEYRNQMGEQLMPPSFHALKFVEGGVDTVQIKSSLSEQTPWMSRSQTQQLGWWAKEALELKLTDILDFYSERMNGYFKLYKTHYGQFQPKLIRGLIDLMNELYGSPLEDYVGRIATVILNKDITKDYVRGYKR